jgi:hypothetical protein
LPKVKFEFYCNECNKYFDIKLNTAHNGNYRIHCPICDHIHYREIENGKITDRRFFDNYKSLLLDDIYPMKASCRDFQEETAGITEGNQSSKGFMSRLWHEKFSGRC